MLSPSSIFTEVKYCEKFFISISSLLTIVPAFRSLMLVSVSGSDENAKLNSSRSVSSVVSDVSAEDSEGVGVAASLVVSATDSVVPDVDSDVEPAVDSVVPVVSLPVVAVVVVVMVVDSVVVVVVVVVVESIDSSAKVRVIPEVTPVSSASSPFLLNFATNMMVPATTMHIPAIRNAVMMVSLRFLLSDTVILLSVTFFGAIFPRQSYHRLSFSRQL